MHILQITFNWCMLFLILFWCTSTRETNLNCYNMISFILSLFYFISKSTLPCFMVISKFFLVRFGHIFVWSLRSLFLNNIVFLLVRFYSMFNMNIFFGALCIAYVCTWSLRDGWLMMILFGVSLCTNKAGNFNVKPFIQSKN